MCFQAVVSGFRELNMKTTSKSCSQFKVHAAHQHVQSNNTDSTGSNDGNRLTYLFVYTTLLVVDQFICSLSIRVLACLSEIVM